MTFSRVVLLTTLLPISTSGWGITESNSAESAAQTMVLSNPQTLSVSTLDMADPEQFMLYKHTDPSASLANWTYISGQNLDTSRIAMWNIKTNDRVEIQFASDDASFTQDDGTTSVGPVLWKCAVDASGAEKRSGTTCTDYESLPTTYVVKIGNIDSCSGTTCATKPAETVKAIDYINGVKFAYHEFPPTESGSGLAIHWGGTAADLISTSLTGNSIINRIGNIQPMDKIGNVSTYGYMSYINANIGGDPTDNSQFTKLNDDYIWVWVKANGDTSKPNTQPGSYSASLKITVTAKN